MDPSSLVPLLFVYILLVIGSAFFSMSEMTFSSITKIKLRALEDEYPKKVKGAMAVLENFDLSLTTLLIGNNIMNVGCATVATIISARVFRMMQDSGATVAQSTVTVIGTILTTVIIFIFGEIFPKTYAKDNTDKLALSLAGTVRTVIVILYPLGILFVGISKLLDKLLGGEQEPSVTEEELSAIIENSEETGVLDEDEVDLLQSALEFPDTTVADVLTLRDDVMWIDASLTKEQIFEKIRGTSYSRLPVCRGSLDRCVGILRTNDFLKAYISGTYTKLMRLLRKPFYTTLTASINDLKDEMSGKRQHIALVRDKSGDKVIGVVTMEDFLEELVGEIFDESDVVDDDFQRLGGDYFDVSGKLPLGEMFRRMKYKPKSAAPTHKLVSTWIMEQLGGLPEEGDSFEWEELTVEVGETEQNRVTRATVKLANPAIDIDEPKDDAAPDDKDNAGGEAK